MVKKQQLAKWREKIFRVGKNFLHTTGIVMRKTDKVIDKTRHKTEEVYGKVSKKIPKRKKKVNKKKRRKIIKNIILFILGLGLVTVTAILLFVSSLDIPDISSFDKRQVEESTKIYDRNGVLLYDIHGDVRRTVVPISQIPKYLQQAHIAIEDEEFYDHIGIDFTAIARALWVSIKNRTLTGQGGSTITQQVVKNSILTREKKIVRKIKEWILAVRLERVKTKDEILEIYLNESPYGGSVYGVEAAAQYFFNKPVGDVTIAESAYLAAMTNAPTYYSPYGNHRDKLEKRKSTVLRKMRDNNFITNNEYAKALKEEVEFSTGNKESIKAPHFVMYVREILEEEFGVEEVRTGGYQVTTTLDYTMQKEAEEMVENYVNVKGAQSNFENAAMVILDPLTGEILTMVGSKDYFSEDIDGKYNVAIAKRQPGSSFKPFEYATAFDQGYTPETILFDVQTQFNPSCAPTAGMDGGCYSPQNYTNKFIGPITIRGALARSLNIPAVKAFYLAGPSRVVTNVRKMGLTTISPTQTHLSTALGSGEVRLVDMVSAFGTFANQGVHKKHKVILSIKDKDENIIKENKETIGERIFKRNTALQISNILSDNVARTPAFGANNSLHIPGLQVAAKTGTTNSIRDVWTIGYTPRVVIGVWGGNNDNSAMYRGSASGIISPLWKQAMTKFYKNFPQESFPIPVPTPTDLKPILRGVWKTDNTYEVVVGTDESGKEIKETKTISATSNGHNILYWVDRNDPRGSTPKNPALDPQFKNWEAGVIAWITKQSPKVEFNSNDETKPSRLKIFIPIKKESYRQSDKIIFLITSNLIKDLKITVNGNPYKKNSGSASFILDPQDSLLITGNNTVVVTGIDNTGKTLTSTETVNIVE